MTKPNELNLKCIVEKTLVNISCPISISETGMGTFSRPDNLIKVEGSILSDPLHARHVGEGKSQLVGHLIDGMLRKEHVHGERLYCVRRDESRGTAGDVRGSRTTI